MNLWVMLGPQSVHEQFIGSSQALKCEQNVCVFVLIGYLGHMLLLLEPDGRSVAPKIKFLVLLLKCASPEFFSSEYSLVSL